MEVFRILFSIQRLILCVLFLQLPLYSIAAKLEVNTYSTSSFGLYDISTLDVYVEADIVHILVGGQQTEKNDDVAIYYMRSNDDVGQDWSRPTLVNNHLFDVMASRGNDAQLAVKNNNLVAIWQAKGEIPGMGYAVSVYSENHGSTWKQGTNPAVNNEGIQGYFDLIADHQGGFHAVWLEDPLENGYQSLRYSQSTDQGKQWRKASTLNDSVCSCCWNTFDFTPDHQLNILYRNSSPRDMSLIQSSIEGVSWKDTGSIGDFQWEFNGCPHVGGGLKSTKVAGSVHLHGIVWTGAPNKAGLYVLTSQDNGKSWSAPQKIGGISTQGDIAVLDQHNVAAVWSELGKEGASIFFSRSTNSGKSWQAPKQLSKLGRIVTHPKLVASKKGFLVMWTEQSDKLPSRLAWQLIK